MNYLKFNFMIIVSLDLKVLHYLRVETKISLNTFFSFNTHLKLLYKTEYNNWL